LAQQIDADPNKKFVIEAFPRNDETLFEWEKTLAHKCLLELVLFLDVEDENTIRQRLLTRGNNSDSWENVTQRIEAFDNSVLPIAKYYFYMQQYPFARVVTDNKSIDEVMNEIQSKMSDLKLAPPPIQQINSNPNKNTETQKQQTTLKDQSNKTTATHH